MRIDFIQQKNNRDQHQGANDIPGSVEGERSNCVAAFALGDKGDSPDSCGQKQDQRIFQWYLLFFHNKVSPHKIYKNALL